MANFGAIVTARENQLQVDQRSISRIYLTDQAHHCVRNSALLAGFTNENLCEIDTNSKQEICLDDLRSKIEIDRSKNLVPFMAIGNAGTTNTGAVDDLENLANICQAEKIWLHIDAAYGGFFAMTDAGRRALSGLERADSMTLDPHKCLF